MKNLLYLFFGLLVFTISSCTIDEQVDPNAPRLNDILTDASELELNLLVSGIESSMRDNLETFVAASGSIAREMYKFDADPRNTEDLLGKEGTSLDNNTFYLTATYNSRYRVIKTANTLLEALDGTTSVSEEQKKGYRAFAKTAQALMYSMVLDYLGDGGIRFDVADPENLGPFLSEADSRTAILSLLDEAFADLPGSVMDFGLSTGFDGFNTPESFGQFNRALAARVSARGGAYDKAVTYLGQSFYVLDATMLAMGPKHFFSTGSGDITNSIFKPAGQNGDQLIVHNRFIENALAGDARLSKFRLRLDPTSQDDLVGTHETALYASNSSPIDIIRNEELVFIMAEARMQNGNLPGAIEVLNVIRTAHGLSAYDGEETIEALTDEWLFQKSYSFWGEGHHMFDMRKYGRLNDTYLPIDREGDLIHTQFPIPLSENQ